MLSSKGVPLGDNLMVIRFIVLVQLGRMALLYPAKDNNVMMWTSLVDTSGFCPPLNVMLLTTILCHTLCTLNEISVYLTVTILFHYKHIK